MAVFSGPEIVNDGLVLHLDAANPRSYPGSGTTWYDLSGNNNGTLVNGAVYDSNSLGNISFDGTNDYTSFSSDPLSNITTAITIDFISLLISNNISPYVPPIITRGDTASTGGSKSHTLIYYSGSSSEMVGLFGQTNGAAGNPVRTSYTLNAIENYTATYDGTTVSIYKNGELKDTASQTGTIYNTNQQPTALGRDVRYSIGRAGRMLNGKIYNMKIYNRALTETEIQQNFEASRSRYGI